MKPLLALSILFLLLHTHASAQLKKSYLGTYEGKIPAYDMQVGSQRIAVGETVIQIQLTAKDVQLKMGAANLHGTWKVLLETKMYFVLEALMENQLAPERILVYKKGKKMSREGIRPQPDALLFKLKK
jgi:hypothetical protein